MRKPIFVVGSCETEHPDSGSLHAVMALQLASRRGRWCRTFTLQQKERHGILKGCRESASPHSGDRRGSSDVCVASEYTCAAGIRTGSSAHLNPHHASVVSPRDDGHARARQTRRPATCRVRSSGYIRWTSSRSVATNNKQVSIPNGVLVTSSRQSGRPEKSDEGLFFSPPLQPFEYKQRQPWAGIL